MRALLASSRGGQFCDFADRGNRKIAYDIVDNIVCRTEVGGMEDAAAALARKGPPAADIADWIRRQISASRLVPGQRLVEVDIIRQTGGSRFKVREALQRLAAEGLVEIEEFRGASVRGASMDEVRQLYLARAAIEGICAADFTRRASPAQRQVLRDMATEMEQCTQDHAPERFGRLNAAWHAYIMEVADNLVLTDMVKRLNTPVHRLLFGTFYRGDRLHEAIADHSRIMDAIEAGDADAAMRRHILNGYQLLTSLDRAVHEEPD
jgi:DNA-binding GntR family transcriptional regulator